MRNAWRFGLMSVALCAPGLLAQGSGALSFRDGDYLGAPAVAPDADVKEMPKLKHCDSRRYALG